MMHRKLSFDFWRRTALGKIIALMLLTSCAVTVANADDNDIIVATFNIQIFGKTKAGKPEVMDYLGAVVRNFDIVAVQEIKDISGQVPVDFVAVINSTGRNYECEISERTGRQDDDQSSQEQYAYCFDTDRIELMEPGFLFDDSTNDLFQREPFSARFRVIGFEFEFTLTTIHTRPESAVEEIGALHQVHIDIVSRFPAPVHHIMLGDFNAGCSYASTEELDGLALRGSSFVWIVPDSADTNVNPNSSCAYDRIVIGAGLSTHFDSWGIGDWFNDKKISDHWPVWIRLSSD